MGPHAGVAEKMEDVLLLFKAASMGFEVGISLICFIIVRLIRERSTRIFLLVYSFFSGTLFGLGSLCFILQSLDGQQTKLRTSLLISSLMFMSMIAVEHIFFEDHGYKPVSSLDLESDDNLSSPSGDADEDPELSGEDDQQADAADCNNVVVHAVNENSKLGRLYPHCLLVVATLYSLTEGLLMGAQNPIDPYRLIKSYAYKALISCILCSILEERNSVGILFLRFCFIFTVASPMGMTISSLLTPMVSVSDGKSSIVTLSYLCDVSSAVCAGTFLNISTVYMIPRIVQSATKTNQQKDRLLKLVLFVMGYALLIVPCFLRDRGR